MKSTGTGDLVIRPRDPSDHAFIVALGHRAFAKYDASARRTMASMLSDPAAIVLVADHVAGSSAEPVGFAIVQVERLGRPFGPWADPARAHLAAIAVRSDRRRHGVGSGLLAHAEETARERGAVSMALTTAETNQRARKVFRAAGYRAMFAAPTYDRGQIGLGMFKAL